MEKPHTGLDECPRILLSGFRAGNSALAIRVQRADIAKVSVRLAEMSSSLTLRPWGEATGAAGASPGRGDDLLEINIVFAPAATPLEA